jgi:hypothetical protein
MTKSFTRIFLLLLTTFWLFSNALGQSEKPYIPDDRVGTIEVETSNGIVRVITGGRTFDLFGRRVKADYLFTIVSERLKATRQKLKCDDEMLFSAAYLLAEVKDARVLKPLLEMSKSSCPYSCLLAVSGLYKLRDRRALPRLLEIIRKQNACSNPAVRTVANIGDETAIPILIDTIPDGGAMDAEARLKAIEEITGLSLDGIRKEWGLLYYGKLKQFHKAMHEWWDAHKRSAKIKEVR